MITFGTMYLNSYPHILFRFSFSFTIAVQPFQCQLFWWATTSCIKVLISRRGISFVQVSDIHTNKPTNNPGAEIFILGIVSPVQDYM